MATTVAIISLLRIIHPTRIHPIRVPKQAHIPTTHLLQGRHSSNPLGITQAITTPYRPTTLRLLKAIRISRMLPLPVRGNAIRRQAALYSAKRIQDFVDG